MILTSTRSLAFRKPDGEWGYIGLGTVILMANATLLWLYTLSCHSCRNTVGGRLKHFSKHPVRYRMWTLVCRLNAAPHEVRLDLAVHRRARRLLHLRLLASGTHHRPAHSF